MNNKSLEKTSKNLKSTQLYL